MVEAQGSLVNEKMMNSVWSGILLAKNKLYEGFDHCNIIKSIALYIIISIGNRKLLEH